MKQKKQFKFSEPYTPAPIRWLNSLSRRAKPVLDRPASLNREQLLEAAGRRTGLQDFGDPRFEEALAAILGSVNREGKLTFFGRFAFRQFLVGNLCSRLRVIEVLKRFPEIRRQKIASPIIITGWYRTGTTYLQNLLASHPNVRTPLYWELRHPCPSTDPRSGNRRRQIRKAEMERGIHRWMAPGFDAAHPMGSEKPEECLHLFEKACSGTTAFFISEAESFAWWLLDHDPGHGYDFFKIQLQLLNWLRPGRQWVLKWPFHLWRLEALLQRFPDAVIILLHRDPCEAIPSVCSLAAAARAPFCDNIDAKALGEFWLNYCEAGLRRGLAAQANGGKYRILDIRCRDLRRNPLSVVDQIQAASGLDKVPAWPQSFLTAEKVFEKKEHPRHGYSPARFGLKPGEIRERFARYIEDYDLSVQ